MSTQFFERQEVQRSYTRWLVVGFVLAILLVTLVINLVVIVGLLGNPVPVLREHPGYFVWISLVVIGTMLVASWHRSSQLRAGGAVVARSLGGVPVTAADGDLKRQRLLNIVEEMAIAARIRRPQVYVLSEEPGINAFAAGNSPDEAAVVVTQGALDSLDRDQLQAVIGHEFSHVLNGDMRINMRLTAWIFGLFVLTDVATRIMRNRSGGKNAARIKADCAGCVRRGQRRPGRGTPVAGRRIATPRASRRCLVGAVHAQSPGIAGRIHRHGRASRGFAPASHGRIRSGAHVIRPQRCRLGAENSARPGSPRIRRSKSACRRSTRASRAMKFRTPGERRAPQDSPRAPRSRRAAEGAPEGECTCGCGGNAAGAAGAAAPLAAGRKRFGPGGHRTFGRSRRPWRWPRRCRRACAWSRAARCRRTCCATGFSRSNRPRSCNFVARVEKSRIAVQATFVATMLAAEPAKWRTQLTRLAPLLGIELFKETQAQVAHVAALAPAARLPLLVDLLSLLDNMEPADRKRLRAIARAFAPTVATGDMLRFAVTRMLEKRLAKAVDEAAPVPLPEHAPTVCELYAALAQCRFGAGKQGQNAYRAGLMGMLPPQKWAPYPEHSITPAALDAALAARRADSSHGQAFVVGGHGTRHCGGWTPHRAASRSAARHLHGGRLPRAAHSHRRRLRREPNVTARQRPLRPARDRASAIPTSSRNTPKACDRRRRSASAPRVRRASP